MYYIYKKNVLLIFIFVSFLSFNYGQTYCEGDSVLLNAVDYTVGQVQWQESNDALLWVDIQGATALSHQIELTASKYYRLMLTDSNCLPPYPTATQYVEVLSMPDVAQAGTNQMNVSGNMVNLNANNPNVGIGTWSIESGGSGVFANSHQFNTTFFGASDSSYVLRWTIHNACGSSYDEINVSFAPFSCGGLLLDGRDGKLYPTVLIGTQCWMAKNLNIGTFIQGVSSQIDNDTIEKYCYEDLQTNCDSMGGMYQWDELMNYTTVESAQGICPFGWHVPSDNEWKILEMTLGMTQTEADLDNTWRGAQVGTALKTGGSSGFEALLGGGRWSNSQFIFVGQMGYFWTSTESGSFAWRRCLSASDHTVGRWNTFQKTFGFHVRCIKD